LVTWHAQGSLGPAIGGQVEIEWLDPSSTSHHWTFIFPPTAPSVQAPALPAALAAWAPDPSASFQVLGLFFGTIPGVSGYDDFRQTTPHFTEVNVDSLTGLFK